MQGIPEMVRKETKRIMEIGKQNGRYIFNSGEMIPRDTPEENMIAMVSTAKEYSKYE